MVQFTRLWGGAVIGSLTRFDAIFSRDRSLETIFDWHNFRIGWTAPLCRANMLDQLAMVKKRPGSTFVNWIYIQVVFKLLVNREFLLPIEIL